MNEEELHVERRRELEYHKMKDWAWSSKKLNHVAELVGDLCAKLSIELREHNPSMPVSVHNVASRLIEFGSDLYHESFADRNAQTEYRWMIIRCVESGEWP